MESSFTPIQVSILPSNELAENFKFLEHIGFWNCTWRTVILILGALPHLRWASLVAQTVKCLPAMRETQVRSLGWKDRLEKEMATHSSTLAWKIPWTEEPGRLQSMGSQRVGHDWATSLWLCPIWGAWKSTGRDDVQVENWRSRPANGGDFFFFAFLFEVDYNYLHTVV